tara:strand:- start:3097 stop:7917 length:4821 start_codon:yes stop_codon:yes gene_type:complete
MNEDKLSFDIIKSHTTYDKQYLVRHHIDSCNLFYDTQIKQIFMEKNPIYISKDFSEKFNEYKLRCELYIGGKDGSKIYYGKPIIYDKENPHYMYPNEARLRNMSYSITIHYDVEVDFFIIDDTGSKTVETLLLEKIYLGRFPIMLQSKLCILNGLHSDIRYSLGECKNDNGGYFIIDGKEKVIIPQEQFGHNMMYIRDKVSDKYTHSCDIKSVSENSSKPIRTLSIRIVAATPSLSNGQIVVSIPNVKTPVPLFILMRALGIVSDKDIIRHIVLDLKSGEKYLKDLTPSVYDGSRLFSQVLAIKYIATLTKGKTVNHAYEILSDYLLPHIGEMNFKEKAYYIGYMVLEMLKVKSKEKSATDRDNFKYKRVETSGELMYQLFKEYYKLQYKAIYQKIDKEYYYHEGIYQKNFKSLIETNQVEFFMDRIVETGFKKGFKGNWGASAHTKRLGAVQDLNRLSFNSAASHLRKLNLEIDASAKVVGPRLLHGSQIGIIDPVDTPDGGNVGLHKHMALFTKITVSYPRIIMLKWIAQNTEVLELTSLECENVGKLTKLFVNGYWCGLLKDPLILEVKFKTARRLGLIPIYTSFSFDKIDNQVHIYTDGGRLCRPIFYIDHVTNEIACMNKKVLVRLEKGDFDWVNCLTGFMNKKIKYNLNNSICYDLEDMYSVSDLKDMENYKGILEYMDSSEAETSLICPSFHHQKQGIKYTHIEIHPSLMFGVMGNQIIFPEHNQLPRNTFGCGQAKQAASIYHSNFNNRIDKMGLILNYGQLPILKSRYLELINKEQHPCGENVMIAIMCHTSYNVEDAILINKGSLDRGLFQTTYYNMYETREESSSIGKSSIDSRITNIQEDVTKKVGFLKPGKDYGHLDENGIIKENTQMNDKIALIGKIVTNLKFPDMSEDASIFPKKGQLGYVDKTYISDDEEGKRLVKIRIRELRTPAMGDKFSSRCGQKGTIGLIIPEENMPYNKDGVKPDIIVNPHAFPSRMTIGQLVEMLMGKAAFHYGAYSDCTAFMNKGPKHSIYGDLLTNAGFHSSGNEILYNGMTGEQIEANICFGPTYYMRLKHMVKDKINYRARGPNTQLTRQPVHGRANDGGLRIGEMERDVIIGHGASKFLNDSLMNRADEFSLAVCNKTGTIAIYNNNLNLFMSPSADGPIQYKTDISGEKNIIQITKFGRSFSIVKVPYAFKLLMQELTSMNVQMRIITEDNISQLDNMAYGKFKKIDLKKIQKPKKPVQVEDSPEEIKDVTEEILNKPIEEEIKLSEAPEEEEYDEDDSWDLPLPQNVMPWVKKDYDGDESYVSVILDDKGTPTDIWVEEYPPIPNIYPADWKHSDIKKYNLLETEVVYQLINTPLPNNWDIVINKLSRMPKISSPFVPEPGELNEGDKVERQYYGTLMTGRITRRNNDGTYNIVYDDEKGETFVDKKFIRKVENANKDEQLIMPPGQVYPLGLPSETTQQQTQSPAQTFVKAPAQTPAQTFVQSPVVSPVVMMPAQTIPVATVPVQASPPLIQSQPMIVQPPTQTTSNSPEFSEWLKMTDNEKDAADLTKNDTTEEDDETLGEKKGGSIKFMIKPPPKKNSLLFNIADEEKSKGENIDIKKKISYDS